MDVPEMARKDIIDRFMACAANIGSPKVLAEIDRALQDNARERMDLVDLRKLAVRRHGETQPEAMKALDIKVTSLFVEEPSAGLGASAGTEHETSVRTLADVANRYQTDADSPYLEKAFATRQHYDTMIDKMVETQGRTALFDINGRVLKRFYDGWSNHGETMSMGHSMMTMLRSIMRFGDTILRNPECERISRHLSDMRFKLPPKRSTVPVSEDQAKALIQAALAQNVRSIALATAILMGFNLRQKDIIGEWIPQSEPGDTDITHGGQKWVRGLRWEHMDKDYVVRRGSEILDFKKSPLVMSLLETLDIVPRRGPMILHEGLERPWRAQAFRVTWRKLAKASGIPDNVKFGSRGSDDDDETDNTDLRAEGIA